jgi:hypothetical protein
MTLFLLVPYIIYPFSIEELFAQVNIYPCLVKLRPFVTGFKKKKQLRHYEFLTANLLVSRHSSLRSVFRDWGTQKTLAIENPLDWDEKRFS